ncbi:MAG: uracil-DNA glycosylase [Litoreibacter sp.]|nr:uracil-DNA glycosylase [Litoreibacter sp.]
MESELNFHRARALLEWQIDLGATEAIGETPINRYKLSDTAPKPKASTPTAEATAPVAAPQVDPVTVAGDMVRSVETLEQLRAALEEFEHCELKKGARNLVFSDGIAGARVMVIGEAPGRDEDMQGKPFVGRAGKLLDAMFEAIGFGRADTESPIYITNILPWRPPQNRDPKPDEIAMMMPFVEKHIELAAPDLLVLMGNVSCQAILGQKGITKLRGRWVEALGKPVMPMFHPAYLLRNPSAKRDAWHDLLMLQAKLKET